VTLPILITGGTGTLGARVVRRLHAGGHDLRVLSRRGGASLDGVDYRTGDLLKGEGVVEAVKGTGVVVHCAGAARGDDVATSNLVRAASGAGVRHLVLISVIGVDRIPVTSRVDRAMFGYFGHKLAAERIVAESGLPWTALRAAQFHQSLISLARQMAKLPVIPVPAGFRFQPVDADDVAERLGELALGSPQGLVPDLAGPRIYPMAELIGSCLRGLGKFRLLLPAPIPGKAARAIRSGANLNPDRAVGRRTWEDVLAASLADPRASAA
jgi:uncharacterized protein YbjT (DUF2867 family)